jgi:hypothetical protein
MISAAVSGLALPFVLLARRERASSDPIAGDEPGTTEPLPQPVP